MCSIICKKWLSQNGNKSLSWVKYVRYLSDKRKFYEEARICHSDGGFEINLDNRKLRTPIGKVVKVPNEGLAHAVSVEWNQQTDVIKSQLMPLTALCYEAMDSSCNRNSDVLAASVLKFLHTDTVLFHMEEPADLGQLQKEKWSKLVDWFSQRHSVNIKNTTGFGKPSISPNTIPILTNYLKSFNMWSLVGIEKMVNTMKSVIVSLSLIDRHVTVEEAVSLSRLEQEFQISEWGNVEWYHDVELSETRMKVAACALFVQLCSEESSIRYLNRATKLS
uniref:ATP synthase mitochondrial F1 complex assembly factor 2-like n=1 Tax=Phallusia mammillata TaxID=59560 RepID=A0A6F9D7G1_9ASCI|nr:ATP synthase mitochondrial F1 complex assembly factor 2-like [Phallusia mammillata]